MSTVSTQVINGLTGETVEATLHTELTPTQILMVEQDWGPARLNAIVDLLSTGTRWEDLPEHSHWNWSNKLREYDQLSCRFMGIEVDGRMQSLVRVRTAGYVARLEPDRGKPLIYVEFLESAPWNARPFTPNPQFKGTGLRLIEAAVRLSVEEEFHGRIGLHTLPQSEQFYVQICGMVAIGIDSDHESLLYCEMSREGAERLLSGGS
jgi:hypothetical protein